MDAYDVFAAAAETNALKVVLEGSKHQQLVPGRRASLPSRRTRGDASTGRGTRRGARLGRASPVTSTTRSDRRRRRHPPRREHASTACARPRPTGEALVRFFRELSDRSLYLRFHGHPTVDERLVDPVARSRLGRPRRAHRIGGRVRRGTGRRARQLRASPRSADRGGRVRGRRRLPGARHRDAAGRAARRTSGESRDRALRRRGDGGQRRDDQRLREGRLRGHEDARRRRGGDDVPDRSDRGLRLAGRGA